MMRELVSIVDDAELDHEIAEVIRDDIVDSLQFARPWVGSAVLRERGIAEHATDTMRTRRAALRSALGMATVERPQDAFNDAENPWRMQEGMRFSSPRRALLRLLQPFVDRQNALNVSNAARIDEALYELKWMQRMAQAKRVRAADAEDPNYNA
jgi:hypothetical protein